MGGGGWPCEGIGCEGIKCALLQCSQPTSVRSYVRSNVMAENADSTVKQEQEEIARLEKQTAFLQAFMRESRGKGESSQHC